MPKTTKKNPVRRSAHRKTEETPVTQSEGVKVLSLALKIDEWARHHNLTLEDALEQALNGLAAKDQPQEDAFLKALESIPEDDEPTTDEDRRYIEQALKEEEAGETITIEEVMKKHGRQR